MIAEADGDDELRAWLRKVIDAKKEIVAFVEGRVDGAGTGEFVGYMKGSFNLCLRVGFGDRRQSAIIRFPNPDRQYAGSKRSPTRYTLWSTSGNIPPFLFLVSLAGV